MAKLITRVLLLAAAVAGASACDSYNRVADGVCADTCLGDFVGLCPRSLIVSKGGLSAGSCSSLGYTDAAGTLKQAAGPCGTLDFNKYTKPAALELAAEGDGNDCHWYRRVDGSFCSDSCLSSFVGICPVSLVISNGELYPGSCPALGYTVSDGTFSQSAGPCGDITFGKWSQKPKVAESEELSAAQQEAAIAASQELLAESFLRGSSDECAPVTPVADLDLAEYTRATWYIQEQQVTGYQTTDDLFCVSATYNIGGRSVPFFSGNVLSVFNYGNIKQVNGKAMNANNATVLCARQKDPKQGGKLLVAPCFLPNLFAGDYWILDIGGEGGRYDWAIISGGQPKVKFDDGCTTKETGINGSGLWLFTREPVASPDVIAMMKDKLHAMGVTTSRLVPVPQDGCERKGAFLKGGASDAAGAISAGSAAAQV